jgi:hypothetical protein
MMYRFITTLFIILISLTVWSVGDKFCMWEQGDDEICSSTGLECGITITVVDRCGERRISCGCGEDSSCDMSTLKCTQGTK